MVSEIKERNITGFLTKEVGMFNYKWFWKSKLPERKNQRCRVLARGKMNSILVEFEDGYKVITSRYAVRLIKDA